MNATSRAMIDTAKWYLGGINTYSKHVAEDFYNAERGENVLTEFGHTTNWIGKVGLVYVSDYAYTFAYGVNWCYSSYITSCNYKSISWFENVTCVNSDTHQNCSSNEDTLTLNSSDKNGSEILPIVKGGSISMMGNVNRANAIPVIYLSSKVSLVGGQGTKELPYKLSIK